MNLKKNRGGEMERNRSICITILYLKRKESNYINTFLICIYMQMCVLKQPEDNLWESDLFIVWVLELNRKKCTGLVEIAFLAY